MLQTQENRAYLSEVLGENMTLTSRVERLKLALGHELSRRPVAVRYVRERGRK